MADKAPAAPAVDPAPITPNPATPTLSSNDKRGDILAYASVALLAYVVSLVFAVVILKIEISAVMMALVTMVVTAVTGGVGVVLGFQFGSSKGSQDKNATIAAQTTPPTSQA